MTKFATHKTAGPQRDSLVRGELLVHGASILLALPGECLQLSAAKFLGT